MEYINGWRSRVPNSFLIFGSLLEQDKSLSIAYGVVAGALLWTVRNDGASPELREALTEICGTKEVQPLLQAVSLLRLEPLATAQALSNAARDSDVIRNQLNRLLEYFRDDWLSSQLLKPAAPGINISGSVEGANLVIGGMQYVAGDLIVSQTLVQKVRACPTAPPPPPHFVGRRAELEHLKDSLSRGGNVAVTGIQGMGGIGKTALALQLATEMSGVGAVLWASLGPMPSAVNHLLSWARHADPDFEAGNDQLDVLANRIQANLTDLIRERCPGQVLVILDDVWEGDSVAAARLLQRAAPSNALYLITTRSQLVAAQLRSVRFELKPMSAEDALRMLRTLLAAHPGVPDGVLLDLAAVVGYHPLAMELAAGQVGLLERPEAEITDLIRRYEGGIPEGDPFREIRLELGETREDNLELVLSFSYDHLDDVEKANFRSLGVLAYAAPFDQQLCRAIWDAEPKPVLDTLRHHALLGIADAAGWYQQHPLLRAYARALLNGSRSDFLQASERYTEYVVGVSEQFTTLPLASWGRQLEPYVPHIEEVGSAIVAATQAELQSISPDEKRLGRALSFALNTSRLLSKRRQYKHEDWMEMGLAVSRKVLDLGYAVFFLNEIGQDSYFRGDQQKAIQKWYEAKKIAEAAADRRSLAQTYSSLGLFFLSSDPMEAPGYLRPAVKLYEELQDPIGLVNSLIHLSEWHANSRHPYHQREAGAALLLRALSVAQTAAYEEGTAQAKLKLGRLRDTLGNRVEAVSLLSESVNEFKQLGQSDYEGTAHLFLASALANLGRHSEAQESLEKALPLFKTTGHRAGQSVTLRNLGQLYGRRQSWETALAFFAEALPLVRKQTMRFLDEDADEVSVASCFFAAQMEDVVKLELVEDFRARGMEKLRELKADGEESEFGNTAVPGFVPDDLLTFLLTNTILVKSNPAADTSAWVSALQGFISYLRGFGQQYRDEVEFAGSLVDVALGRAPMIGEENGYFAYVGPILARIAHKHRSPQRPLLPVEAVEQFVNNTLAVRIQRKQLRDWSIQLRKHRRQAAEWGEHDEVAFYSAQLAVLSDRLISLPPENSYSQSFERLLSELARYELLPLDYALESTVAAKMVVPERSQGWLRELRQFSLDAVRYGNENERQFYEALIRLMEDKDVELKEGNPYRVHLQRVQSAISSGQPLVFPLPSTILAYIAQQTIAARTTEPKTIDWFAKDLAEESTQARMRGRFHDVELYDALLSLLFGEQPALASDNVYRPLLQQILEGVRRQSPQPSRNITIPNAQAQTLVDEVVAVLTDPAKALEQVRDNLRKYRRLLESRGPDWDNERAFAEVLLDMLTGQHRRLPQSNPYQGFVENAYQEISRHKEIRAKGGLFEPAQVDALLGETARQWKGVRDFMNEGLKEPSNLAALFEDNRMSDMVKEQNRWKETLIKLSEDVASKGESWHHEGELIAALIAVVDSLYPKLSVDSPYSAAFQEMLKEIGYTQGFIPAEMQVAALASSTEEYTEHFAEVVSGKSELLEKLDIMLTNTVAAKTLLVEGLDWEASLERIYQRYAEHNTSWESTSGSVSRELELIRALQAVMRDETPALPADHPYYLHVSQVVKSIAMFHSQSTSPQTLPGDQIERLFYMTSGVMTIGADQFSAWKDYLEKLRQDVAARGSAWLDTVAFVDALLVVLQGRPTDLPLENPYRPYLHVTTQQIKQMA